MAQATDVKAWFNDECEAIPGKTMPNFVEVERNYPDTYKNRKHLFGHLFILCISNRQK
jgi:nitrate reductase alpha subunit